MSAKIRLLLEEHLQVQGLKTVVQVRHITDPGFWADFDASRPERELHRATIRKATELKKITYEKKAENPVRYATFSERVLEVIRRFEEGQLAAAEALKALEEVAKDLEAEGRAHEASGLNERAYGVLKILEAFVGAESASGTASVKEAGADYGQGEGADRPGPLEPVAERIDGLYSSPDTAPAGWHRKDQLRRKLRVEVRGLAHDAGLRDIKDVAARVEDYALRHYARLA